MIAMPILGWLTLSAYGKPIPFFGLELPSLIEKNTELRDLLKEIHEIGGSIGYILLAGHATAGCSIITLKKIIHCCACLFLKINGLQLCVTVNFIRFSI